MNTSLLVTDLFLVCSIQGVPVLLVVYIHILATGVWYYM